MPEHLGAIEGVRCRLVIDSLGSVTGTEPVEPLAISPGAAAIASQNVASLIEHSSLLKECGLRLTVSKEPPVT